MGDLKQRVITALVALPIALVLLILGGVWFSLLILFLVLVGESEFYRIVEMKGVEPMRITGYILSILLVVVAYFSNEYYLNLILTMAILFIFIMQLYRRDVKTAISSISSTIVSIVYVAWLISHGILLRNIGNELVSKYGIVLKKITMLIQKPDYMGLAYVVLVVAVTFLADTAAYFVGKSMGKHKLAPVVSPKKTWEGAIAGVVTAIITAVLTKWIMAIKMDVLYISILGLLLGIFGILGDLSESLLKRDVNIKDSGTIFPGHGGVLDRLDSLMFNVPITYYFVKTYYYYEIIKLFK